MKISSYNPQDRYRRRAADRMAGIITVFILVVVSFATGYLVGNKKAGHQERYLKRQVEQLEDDNSGMQDQITELRAETQTANARFEQLQELYNETVPEGPMKDLVSLLKKQVDEGRDPERLAFLIRSARPPRNCTEPQTKRFVVSTPTYQGPDSKIVLADGALVVTANGASAMNGEGAPEAWYDPSKSVAIEFTGLGGKAETKSGVMPIHHSIVIADKEYRMSVTEGAKSFAKISFDSCDYP
ncbi:MAG: hypothetical protein KTR28_05140 [Micavibrio sp.]|nr:hypothetical protein [Micavibrio sp.]